MAEDRQASPEPRRYTREFKLEAVRLSEGSGQTDAQIARDLGVPERVLYRWRHELREQSERTFPGKGHQSVLEEEHRRLRRELELLKQEREILKKRSPSSRAASHEGRVHRQPYQGVPGKRDVPCVGGVSERLLRLGQASRTRA